MIIILTRHGRTVENDAGILQGHLPWTLNELGLAQAAKVAERLSAEKIDRAYSSDLARAADTARAIMAYHPGTSLEFTQELRESSLGDWQWKTKEELGLAWKPVTDDMFPENAESVESISARAKGFIERLLSVHSDDTVLLVGHDSINRRLVSAITGEVCTEGMKNASVSVFEILPNGEVAVREFNCVKHLG